MTLIAENELETASMENELLQTRRKKFYSI